MLSLKELRLRNYLLFQEQDFSFETGLTVIQGRNRSGKSLLLSSISGMLHGLASGENFPKGSRVELDLARITPDSKVNLRICASSPKTKPDWELYVQKKDMATHRKRDVRALIDRYVPITEDLFNSTGHLIAGKSMPLFQGTPAVKMDWMSSVFNLAAKYSSLVDLVSARLEALQKDEVRLSVLRQQLQELPEPINPDRYAKLKKSYDKFSASIKEWSELSRLNEELQALNKLLSAMSKRKTELTTEEELETEIQRCKKQLRKAQDQEDDRQAYRDDCAAYDSYIKRKNSLLAKLPKQIRTPKDAEQLLLKATKTMEHAKSELYVADELNNKRLIVKQARKDLARVKKPALGLNQAQEQLAKAKDRIILLKGLTRKVTNVKDGTCPECGTPLTQEHINKVFDRYNKQITKQMRLQDEAQEAVLYYELRKTAQQEVRTIDIEEMERQVVKSAERIKLLNRLLDLKRVEKPAKPEVKYIDIESVRARLGDLESDMYLLQAHGRSKFPSQKKSEERVAELERQLKGFVPDKMELLSEKTLQIGEKLQEMRVRRNRYTDILRRNTELQKEIQELEESVKRIRPLRALKDAFSRNGIVLSAMNDVIEHLLQELNDLVPRLIGEKFRIDIVTGPRKLNVMIERNGVVGSLRTLSMSEQRCWQLLFATAMIRILPNNMLLDTIILDELESNMDEANRKLYTTEFLPYLQTLVPKVIVISPLIRGELPMQPDRCFLVEKKNNTSTLRQL